MNDSADAEIAEVVRVIDECSLIDSESYQRPYQAGLMRSPGHYIVRWPKQGATTGAYDEQAVWLGPYPARLAAERMLESEFRRPAVPLDTSAGVAATRPSSPQIARLGRTPHRHADA
jgi:hypothetical protein